MSEHDAAIDSFGQWWRRTVRSGYGYAQAWRATRQMPRPVNDSKLKSAFAWVVVVPLAIAVIAILLGSPALMLLLPLAYALQIFRIALRRERLSFYGLRASAMIMIAKVAEVVGATRLLLERRPQHSIEYKLT